MACNTMNMPLQLDQIDSAILDRLQARAKLTNVQLAQEIGLSPAATLERVRKLEHQGVIKGYYANIDHKKLSLSTCVMMQVTLQPLTKKNAMAFREAVRQMPEVTACYQVVGDASFFLKVMAVDMPAYQRLITHRFGDIPGVQRVKSFVVTDIVKEVGVSVASAPAFTD